MELLVHSPEHRHGRQRELCDRVCGSGGNAGTAVTATTDASAVSFDKTAPTLGVVQIAAPGTDTSKAKVGDLVTLSFTASEALQQSPTCTFKSGGASVSGSATTADGGDNDAATWSCSYTAQSTDTAGNVSFAIGFVDLAATPALPS